MWRPADIASALRQARTPAEQGHRPWPMPERPWIMGQSWEDVLLAHWRVEEAELKRLVPAQIPLDTFDGSAWIGVTPFVVTGLRARFAPPLPGTARFPEINVRTYATVGGRRGIWFFSLDTPNLLAIQAARKAYRLPYFRSRIDVAREGGRIRYRSERIDRHGPRVAIDAEYGPAGEASHPAPGSFEGWAAERYCLYTLDARGRVLRGEIHHPPWPLRPAEASFRRNDMGGQVGIELDGEPVLHFASRQDVVFWLNRPVS